jgi:hypothetical protein
MSNKRVQGTRNDSVPLTRGVSDKTMSNDIRYNSDLASKKWMGYFDLLGMKQLYRSKNHISIFVALSSAIEKFKERTTAWQNVGYAWFSDTFIVYAADDSGESFVAIDNISRWFFYFLITADIPVRGAISCDGFYVDRENDLFFGEALIEAYEYGELQDWIGLLLCPSAEENLKRLGSPAERHLNYAYTDVPFHKEQKKRISKLRDNLPACILGNWVSVNDQNPIVGRLNRLKERIFDENIRSKYDRTIEFILKNKRVLASENQR